ncbi:FAD-dependent oxidoreductase [Paraburkholderia agricolaris]|uniref:FAD-dependent oxidoreductase n=1 Tax=Paraburkholderia agricolaris TaxID=2152888 RepID=A0ABW9A0T9_9BURK
MFRTSDVVYDVAIVGAGIIGANVAAYASKAGLNCLVLDQSVLGTGASRPSLGLFFPYGRSSEVRDYAYQSQHFYSRVSSEYKWRLDAIGICDANSFHDVRARFCIPIADEGCLEQSMVRESVGLEIVGLDEKACFRIADCHRALPYKIAEQLLFASGVQIWEGARVDGLREHAVGTEITLADGRSIVAGAVILATGPWLPESLDLMTEKVHGLRIKKVVAFHVDIEPSERASLVYFFDEDAFLMPDHQQKKWLFSITSDVWGVKPDSSTLVISSEDRIAAYAILDRYAPSMMSQMNSGRVFCDAYSADRIPLVRSVADRVIACGAANGSGYRLAPGIAAHAMSLAIGR